MKAGIATAIISTAALVLATGCGSANSVNSQTANVDASLYQLDAEPDGAVGVIAARESVKDGAPLVLVGRVGGSAHPWIDGRAAFMLLDASMSVVAEGEGSGEDELCLGDCCATERLDCTALVKVVDAQGKIVPVDSRELLGLNKSDLVVIQGNAKRDESGNFVMLAKGVFIRK